MVKDKHTQDFRSEAKWTCAVLIRLSRILVTLNTQKSGQQIEIVSYYLWSHNFNVLQTWLCVKAIGRKMTTWSVQDGLGSPWLLQARCEVFGLTSALGMDLLQEFHQIPCQASASPSPLVCCYLVWKPGNRHFFQHSVFFSAWHDRGFHKTFHPTEKRQKLL